MTTIQTRRPASPSPRRTAPDRRRLGMVRLVLRFVTAFLILQTLIGEGGLLDMRQATRERRALTAAIATLRRENARLRVEARKLQVDPETIRMIARQELGLIEPGEILFIVPDAVSTPRPTP